MRKHRPWTPMECLCARYGMNVVPIEFANTIRNQRVIREFERKLYEAMLIPAHMLQSNS